MILNDHAFRSIQKVTDKNLVCKETRFNCQGTFFFFNNLIRLVLTVITNKV